MAEKMYLNEAEAAEKLRCTVEQLTDYAREGKLQQYQDGAKKVYRSDQIDELLRQLTASGTGGIELSPADTASGQPIPGLTP